MITGSTHFCPRTDYSLDIFSPLTMALNHSKVNSSVPVFCCWSHLRSQIHLEESSFPSFFIFSRFSSFPKFSSFFSFSNFAGFCCAYNLDKCLYLCSYMSQFNANNKLNFLFKSNRSHWMRWKAVSLILVTFLWCCQYRYKLNSFFNFEMNSSVLSQDKLNTYLLVESSFPSVSLLQLYQFSNPTHPHSALIPSPYYEGL